MGSKSRIAKDIVPIIQRMINEHEIETYIEPFCGGCNVIDKVECNAKVASDNNKHLIAMLQNLDRINGLPGFISKDHYADVRSCFNTGDNKYPDWYIGAVGFLASYNGRFFDGGYSGSYTLRNYYDEARRNLIEQIPCLNGIDFKHSDYTAYRPEDYKWCLFYLDPPYKDTKQYGTSKAFDYHKFWTWAREMAVNNIVLVSEHSTPENIRCIWEKPIKRTVDNTKRVDTVERLFIIEN